MAIILPFTVPQQKAQKNSPLFPEVWKEIKPFLGNKTVVVHNKSFDMYAMVCLIGMITPNSFIDDTHRPDFFNTIPIYLLN